MDFAVEKKMEDAENLLRIEMVELLQLHGVRCLLLRCGGFCVAVLLTRDPQGSATLHGCASYNDVERAQRLLQQGADVNQVSRCGSRAVFDFLRSANVTLCL
jgi:hypothetical protein